MPPLIYVQPDRDVEEYEITARFTVPAEMSDEHVREKVFPQAAATWDRQMQLQGYHLHSKVGLLPRRYDHIEAGDDEPIAADYEHDDAKRVLVDRKMRARFLRQRVLINREEVERWSRSTTR